MNFILMGKRTKKRVYFDDGFMMKDAPTRLHKVDDLLVVYPRFRYIAPLCTPDRRLIRVEWIFGEMINFSCANIDILQLRMWFVVRVGNRSK